MSKKKGRKNVCQPIVFGASIFKYIDEQNKKNFGYSCIVLGKNGELIAVP